jgi:HlyD family secretion protein
MSMKYAPDIIAVSVVCQFALLLCSCSPSQGEQSTVPTPAKAPSEVTCLGKIVPGEGIVKVAAPASSIVEELLVRRGEAVKKGSILALLDTYPSAQAALREAEAQVSVAESAVRQTEAPEKPAAIAAQEAAIARQQAVVKNAESDYSRRKQLFDEHLIPEVDFETAELNLNTAREALRRETQLLANQRQVRDVDVELARRKLAAAEASRDRAAAEIEHQIVRAPMSATVLEIFARPGETPGPEGILDLGDVTRMFVEAEVYATDIRLIHPGAHATVTGEAFDGKLTGTVKEILREAGYSALFPADPSNAADKRIVRVRIALDDPAKVSGLSNSQVVTRIAL